MISQEKIITCFKLVFLTKSSKKGKHVTFLKRFLNVMIRTSKEKMKYH